MLTFPVDARLKNGEPIHLQLAASADAAALRALFEVIIREGRSYPHTGVSDEEFHRYWFLGTSTVVAYRGHGSGRAELAGAFYLRSNWPGRSRHVANAGFIVAPSSRNNGLGWLLGATMLQYAKELGYRSVIFNLVFSENLSARRLWLKLGFSELAVIPEAVRNDDGRFQDAIIMWRSLEGAAS